MKRILYAISLFIILGSCNRLDSYYQSEPDALVGTTERVNQSIITYIQSNPKTEMFATLLAESLLIEDLNENMHYTFWIPSSEVLVPLLEMEKHEMREELMHHISETRFPNSLIKPGSPVFLYSGKRVVIEESVDGECRLSDATISTHEVITNDGVVHFIDTLITPMKSLYERLDSDEYTLSHKLLNKFNKRVFDKENSTPIGVNEDGDVVYDTVWYMSNTILEKADIRNEEKMYTLMLTSDINLENTLTECFQDYSGILGRPLERKDSSLIEGWVASTMIFEHLPSIESANNEIYSVMGNLWRFDKQQVSRTPIQCSNGTIFQVEDLHIPKYLQMQKIENNIWDICKDKGFGQIVDVLENRILCENSYDTIVDLTHYTPKKSPAAAKVPYLQVGKAKVQKPNNPSEFQVTVGWELFGIQKLEDKDTIVTLKVMPGEYAMKVKLGYNASYCRYDVDVLMNGELVGDIKIPTTVKNQEVVEYDLGVINIPERFGTNPIDLRFKTHDKIPGPYYGKFVGLHSVYLEPTSNNY